MKNDNDILDYWLEANLGAVTHITSIHIYYIIGNNHRTINNPFNNQYQAPSNL